MNTTLNTTEQLPDNINLTILNVVVKDLNDIVSKIDKTPNMSNDERVSALSKAQGLLFTASGESIALLTESGKIIGTLCNPNADRKMMNEWERTLLTAQKDRN
jgi:hypothetical protein